MTETFRKIALRLNEMHHADRDWLLSQLPEDARERITPLLRELTAMGADDVPASTFDDLAAYSARAVQAASKLEVEAHNAPSGIAHADHESIQTALAEEPDWVVALVVSYAEWPWLEDFIEALPRERVSELHVSARELGAIVKPRVKDTILRALAERLPSNGATSHQSSRFDRLVERLPRNGATSDQSSRFDRLVERLRLLDPRSDSHRRNL